MLKSVGRALLLPWHALQIVSGRKSFTGNPFLGSERLNRRGLHIWRVKSSARIVDWRRRRLQALVSEEERRLFAERGYIERRDLLPPAEFRRLRAEIEALVAPAHEMTEGRAVTRRIPLTPRVLSTAPAIGAFLSNAAWTGPIRYVGGFNVEPVLSVQTIFGASTSGQEGKDPQTDMHMDTFHSTVKAWFFLYDVQADEGPFTYVAGSHKLTPRRLAWQKRRSVLAARTGSDGSFRISPSELKRLRLPEPTAFDVPANTLVVGDTFGFHARGRSARPTVRVELYASQRPNPFLPFVNLDTALIPFVSGRKEVIDWYFDELLHRIGLKRRLVWRPVGKRTPLQGLDEAGAKAGAR